jgi:medium-chain acyl-[acyl-carrier-protein] hydrolase
MELIEALARAIVPLIDRPYAFFGHSMGSWIAFELARWMRKSGLPLPLHLFASSRRAPQMAGEEAILHRLPDSELLLEIQRRYGGIPAAVLREPDLLALLLPALRADLTALETHRHRDEPPLVCPIASYGGDTDDRVPLHHLEAWRDLTSGPFRVRQFHGGHFYLQADGGTALLREIEERLKPYLSADPPEA